MYLEELIPDPVRGGDGVGVTVKAKAREATEVVDGLPVLLELHGKGQQ